MYVHCTYTFMNVNICMYIVQTRLRQYSSTTTLHFSSGPISLATQASLSSAQPEAPFLQSCLLLPSVSCWNNLLNPVCACTDLVCTMYIHCICSIFAFYFVQTLLCTVYRCTKIDIRGLDVFLKKSYRKATHLP